MVFFPVVQDFQKVAVNALVLVVVCIVSLFSLHFDFLLLVTFWWQFKSSLLWIGRSWINAG